MRNLSQQQTNTDSSLNEFMQECERTLEEFSRLCFGGEVLQSSPQNELKQGLFVSSANPSTKRCESKRKRQILRLASEAQALAKLRINSEGHAAKSISL